MKRGMRSKGKPWRHICWPEGRSWTLPAGRANADEDESEAAARAAESLEDEEAPELVQAVGRLREDVRAMKVLTEGGTPARYSFRGGKRMTAFYVPGDASGTGF